METFSFSLIILSLDTPAQHALWALISMSLAHDVARSFGQTKLQRRCIASRLSV